jgi:hypothetical protein
MAADPLDQVLRLVAEGRLTAEEAAPILAALDEAPAAAGPGARPGETGRATGPGSTPPGGFGFHAPPGVDGADRFTPGDAAADTGPGGSATSLRIEVRDNGRNVVNLRLPIGVGRFALDRVPGLSGDQVDRVREAMNTGFRGPVLVVDDGDSGVRIVLE